MTNPTPLSPAAQAVWQQFCGIVEDHGPPRLGLAAALRAAADQVVPENRKECEHFTNEAIRLNRMGVRTELLAIAAEIEWLTSAPPAARRPKPPSLKQQALEGLTRIESTGEFFSDGMKDLKTIRRALEQLDD